MPLDLQRIVGPVKTEGSSSDPIHVIAKGISTVTFHNSGSVTNVPTSTKTTILTQLYVATTFENIVKVVVSGDVYAKFYLTVNSVDIDVRRSGPDRNLIFDFTGSSYALTTGDIVDIKVEHFDTGLYNFESTIYGYAG